MVVPVQHRGPRGDAVLAAVARAGAPPLVSEGHGHGAGAGASSRSTRRSRASSAPPGGGRGALRDHVRPRLPHHLDRPHRVRGRGRGGRRCTAGAASRSRIRSPARSPTSALLVGAAVLGRKLMPLAEEGKALGVMLPNANGAAVDRSSPSMSAGRVPAMINFTAGAANILAACKAAEIAHHRHLARLHREGASSTPLVERARARRSSSSISRTCAPTIGTWRQAARPARGRASRWSRARPTIRPSILFTSGLGRHAEGRRALPPQHAGERRPGRRAHRLRPHRQGVQRAAGVPLLRPDGRH